MKALFDWLESHRFVTLAIVMLIVWSSLLTFYYLKTDEITQDPCTICSERHGQDVICTIGGIAPVTRVYHVNKSIEDIVPKLVFDDWENNFSLN